MDAWLLFVKENFWGLLIVAIALVILLSIVKTMVKWVILLLVVVGIYLYGANFVANIQDIGNQAVQFTKEQAIRLIIEEAKKADYALHEDGTYTITSEKMKLTGKVGANEATLEIYGQKIPIQVDQTLKAVIDQLSKQKK